MDGELPGQRYPVTPGHEVIGIVEETGEGVDPRLAGRRAGRLAGRTCGRCAFCLTGRENLCDAAAFTGYTRDGALRAAHVAEAAYVYPLPQAGPAESMAPWMRRPDRLARAASGWRRPPPGRTGSARPGRRWRKSAPGNIAVCMPTPDPATRRPVAHARGAAWAGDSGVDPPEPWTRPSSSRPSASLYPWPCGRPQGRMRRAAAYT